MATTAPACATCGEPLRWIAEQHAWRCGRCSATDPPPSTAAAEPPGRTTQASGLLVAGAPDGSGPPGAAPASTPATESARSDVFTPYAPGHHAPPYTPFPSAPPAPAPQPSAPRNRTRLYLAAGGGALLLVIIIAAAASRDGGGGGLPRDALVKRSVAALADGDVDDLIELASFSALQEKLTDCPVTEQSRQSEQQQREEFERAVRRVAAYKKRRELDKLDLEVTAITPRVSESLPLEKGAAANAQGAPACKMKIDATVHTLRVEVKVNGKRAESLKLVAIEAESKWYLAAFTTGGGDLIDDSVD